MNEPNIKHFLSLLGVGNGELHGEWVRASCPLAFARHKSKKDSNPSFGVHLFDQGRSGFNCYGCNIRGKTLDGLLSEMLYYKDRADFPDIKLAEAYAMLEDENAIGYHPSDWAGTIQKVVQKFEEWPEWWLDSFPDVFSSPDAMAYLNSRGVPSKLWELFDLRFDNNKRTICFPLRTGSGRLAGMRGRFLKPKGNFRHFDYSYNQINNSGLVWLGENLVDFMKPLVVVEGQFDYASVFRVYPNVVANLTTSLSEQKVKKLETALEVVTFFDDDEAGAIAHELLRDRLGAVSKVTYPKKSVTKDKQDPGELTVKQLVDCLSKVVPVDTKKIVT